MITAVGTCGACGGCVGIPSVWMGVVPPKPTCQTCGRHPKESYGKVLDMENEPKSLPTPSPTPKNIVAQKF